MNYFVSLGDNGQLSLQQLTRKTVTPLALTRASRSADLSQLDIKGCHYNPDGVTFAPSSLAKQSSQGKANREFFFTSFPDSIRLCAVTTLGSYEDRTQDFREEETKLFLATIKPHRAVSSSTIAIW